MKAVLWGVFLLLAGSGIASAADDRSRAAAPAAPSALDAAVLARLAELGIAPAGPCSDEVFLRRVYLDAVATLPTAAEARKFLSDPDPNKRAALIDRLLQRDEFADAWTMKWGDLLRIKAEFPINLWPNAAQAYHHWVRSALRENLAYDRFVRALLTANGSNFRAPPANFYRALQSRTPEGMAQAVALTFMGARAERWPEAQRAGMARCFAAVAYKSSHEWKEEIVYFDPVRVEAGPTMLPDGTTVLLTSTRDPREVFADWLIDPRNPWFTRAIVNRVWSWILGRGIVQEPDDLRADNPPVNPELLVVLENEFVASHYDLRELFRLILNSQTYQRSCVPPPGADPGLAAANFAVYPVRRLDAEVLIDALNQITGTTEQYSSAIPEPFTFIPGDVRAIALPDGSITSSFLELFGRPPRDTGLESERSNRLTDAQRLHLLNSSHVQRKIEQGPRLGRLLRTTTDPRELLDALYLTILSRFPTADERRIALEQLAPAGGRARTGAYDVAWALINSTEFLHRH